MKLFINSFKNMAEKHQTFKHAKNDIEKNRKSSVNKNFKICQTNNRTFHVEYKYMLLIWTVAPMMNRNHHQLL